MSPVGAAAQYSQWWSNASSPPPRPSRRPPSATPQGIGASSRARARRARPPGQHWLDVVGLDRADVEHVHLNSAGSPWPRRVSPRRPAPPRRRHGRRAGERDLPQSWRSASGRWAPGRLPTLAGLGQTNPRILPRRGVPGRFAGPVCRAGAGAVLPDAGPTCRAGAGAVLPMPGRLAGPVPGRLANAGPVCRAGAGPSCRCRAVLPGRCRADAGPSCRCRAVLPMPGPHPTDPVRKLTARTRARNTASPASTRRRAGDVEALAVAVEGVAPWWAASSSSRWRASSRRPSRWRASSRRPSRWRASARRGGGRPSSCSPSRWAPPSCPAVAVEVAGVAASPSR